MATLLKFYAPWCLPCKAMEPTVEAATDNVNVEVISINIDEDPDAARKYRVRSIPTLVLVKEGKENRLVGLRSLDEVKDFLNQV